MSGASWGTTFRRIILPLLKPGLLAGWIYVMIVSIRELSTSILLYSPDTQVISIVIWELWENGQYVELSALGVLFIIALFCCRAGAARRRQFGSARIRNVGRTSKRRLGRAERERALSPNTPTSAARWSRPRRTSASTCPRASSSRCSARAAAARRRRCARSPGSSGRAPARSRSTTASSIRRRKGVFVAPNRRGFGMVFQSYAIWPHMNVFENAAFPLRGAATRARRKRDPRQGDARAHRPCSSTTSPSARRPSSPAASSSAWRWRARW